MNFRAQLLSSALLVSLIACEPPAAEPPTVPNSTTGLTDNSSQDAGEVDSPADAGPVTPDAGIEDAGPGDAGQLDAGPPCPTLTRPTPEGCVAQVSVRLTGTARAIRGTTLIAGSGQQPVLEAFVDAPPGSGTPVVAIALAPVTLIADAGVAQSQDLASATTDDAGTHYDYPWTTTGAPEGLYVARAEASFGDAGFESDPIYILVDRTAPVVTLTLDFDVDAGVQPRDFGALATIVASDGRGSGEVGLGLAAGGVSWAEVTHGLMLRVPAWVDLPVELPTVEGGSTSLQTRVRASRATYDAWSTAADGSKITIRATATDLAGNVSSAEIAVPVTRQLWQGVEVASTGPVSLGAQGQILVNHGASLDALFPDGTLQSTTRVAAEFGGQIKALGRPETMVSPQTPTGEVYVPSIARLFGAYTQISSVGPFDAKFHTFSPAGLSLAFALSASRGSIYVMPGACDVASIDSLTGATGTTTNKVYADDCSGAQLALGKNDLIATSPTISLIESIASLEEVFAQPQPQATSGFPPSFLGDQAVLQEGSALLIYDTKNADVAQVVDLTAPLPTNAVTSSLGDIYFLAPSGVLSKTDSKGTQLWALKLRTGTNTTGLVIGKDGDTLYAVDGSGQLSAYDSGGFLHWKSPEGTVDGEVMIDRCTGHAYAGTNGPPVAVVLDSLGVDASPDSWPMGGHDVFQTFDSEGTADVDCADHL